MPRLHLGRATLAAFALATHCLLASAAPPLAFGQNFANPVSCPGSWDGRIYIEASGGVAPYTFTITPNPTNYPSPPLYGYFSLYVPAGTYTVTITDAASSTVQQPFVVGAPTALAVAMTGPTPVSAPGASDGTASLDVTGGTPPYSYYWPTTVPITSSSASNLAAGYQGVQVTDANSCFFDLYYTVATAAPAPAGIVVPTPGSYSAGQALNIQVGFTQPVNVTGTPRIPLTIGNTTVYADYVSGSGTNALTFRYTVRMGDRDTDGITVGGLALNGGAIRNSLSQDTALTPFAPGSTSAVLVETGIASPGTNGWSIDQANSAGFIPLTGHAKSPATAPPAGYTFPQGLYDFKLVTGTPGSTASVTIFYPAALPAGIEYWKFGPEPGNLTAHWYRFPGAVVSPDRKSITLTIQDGQQGDSDLATAGSIMDPGGPAVPPDVTGVPSLSTWTLMLLSSILAMLGLVSARRRGN